MFVLLERRRLVNLHSHALTSLRVKYTSLAFPICPSTSALASSMGPREPKLAMPSKSSRAADEQATWCFSNSSGGVYERAEGPAHLSICDERSE